jgi:hypothetical protein
MARTPEVDALEGRLLLHAGLHVPASDSASESGFPNGAVLATEGGAQLLPDLIPLADQGRGYLHGWTLDGGEIPGRALLRVTTAIANLGMGALEVRGGGVLADGRQEVFQRVYREGGGSTDRLAGTFTFHPGHGHIHLDAFTQFRLREITAGDGVGPVVRSGDKISFCLVDAARVDGYPAGAAVYLDCGEGNPQGISVGWADVYNRNLPNQWIDVTGVTSGRYWLEVVADPDDRISESDESNNSARISVDIDPLGSILRADRFESNDSTETATAMEVPMSGRSEDFLSLHSPQDQDYFRFTTAFTGRQVVQLSTDANFGPAELYLYGPDQTLLSSSASGAAVQIVSAAVTQGQAYTVRVKPAAGAVNPNYTMTVKGPPPTVSISAADASAAEAGASDAGTFIILRDGPTDGPLPVQYAVGGNASAGTDYESLSGSVVIPVFETSVAIQVRPLDDGAREGEEVVSATLSPDVSYEVAPGAAIASVVIVDDEPPTPLPAPWATADVGPAFTAGLAENTSDGRLILKGAGPATPAPGQEAFHFAYQPVARDAAVIAKLLDWDHVSTGAKAGITLRESLAPTSRGVSILVGVDNTVSVVLRRAARKKPMSSAAGSTASSMWLRLARSSRTIVPAISSDGLAWQTLRSIKVKLSNAPIYGGLVSGYADGGAVAAAVFSEASVLAVPPAPHGLAAVAAGGPVNLSWLHAGESETGFIVERSLKRRRGYVTVGMLGADVLGFTDTSGLVPGRRYFYRVWAVNTAGASPPSEVVPVVVA